MKKKLLVLMITLASTMMPNMASALTIVGYDIYMDILLGLAF
jgi:hypothetical protein